MDTLSLAKRRECMSRVKGLDTVPEKTIRTYLHKHGYRFRLHVGRLPGKPDIVLARHRAIVFVNGCFWHGHQGCRRARRPRSNEDFWNKKLDGNMRRDRAVRRELKRMGWNILDVWECEIKEGKYQKRISTFMARLLGQQAGQGQLGTVSPR